MEIKKLKLTNFRNYNSLTVEFSPFINFISGDNGEGKTNILEAISILSLGKSFVTSQEINCIKIQEEYAYIEAEINSDKVKKINFVISPLGKKVTLNGKEIKRISELSSKCLTVTFSPKDVRIFKDSPLERRKFINLSLSMLSKTYMNLLKQYNEFIKKRNLLLKQEIDWLYILTLDEQIAPLSYEIVKIRTEFMKNLEMKVKQIYKYFALDESEISLYYKTFIPFESEKKEYVKKFLEIIKQNYESDLKRKSSSKGIHYDDFTFLLNGNDISIIGSQGQNRIASLALKLGLASLVENISNDKPILLLDDVLSELDDYHQQKLVEILKNLGQIFISGNEVNKTFENCVEYKVSNHEVRRITKNG